jgi:heme-degrading monooxygenase HmoA
MGEDDMIVRTWRGATRVEDAEQYLEYVYQTGVADYLATPGNCGALVLRRVVADRAELLLITFWDSEEAVRRFAGPQPDRAVFYPNDDRFLVARDEHVDHYELVFRALDSALARP